MKPKDDTFSDDLEALRHYLLTLVQATAPTSMRGRLDESAIVQESLLEVTKQRNDGRLKQVADLRAYVRKIASGNLTDALRKLGAAKRDFRREVSLDRKFQDASGTFSDWLAGSQLTPSGVVIEQEKELSVARALQSLPDAQRQAITLHHLRGMTLQETATQMDKTKSSVASLIFRGLRSLRQSLTERED